MHDAVHITYIVCLKINCQRGLGNSDTIHAAKIALSSKTLKVARVHLKRDCVRKYLPLEQKWAKGDCKTHMLQNKVLAKHRNTQQRAFRQGTSRWL